MFGFDPLNKGSPQDGVEYALLTQVVNDQCSWKYIPPCTQKSLRIITTDGFMPVPYSQRFIVFGSKRPELTPYLMWCDDEDFDDSPKPRMFIHDEDDLNSNIMTPIDYDDKKYTFDKNNTPFLFRSFFHVFGADGKLVYLCDRNLTQPK